MTTTRWAWVVVAAVATGGSVRADAADPDDVIGWQSLIVHARSEQHADGVRLRVVETWKGHYDPAQFTVRPAPGLLPLETRRGWEEPLPGRDVIVSYRRDATGMFGERSGMQVAENGVVTEHLCLSHRSYTFGQYRLRVRATVAHQRALALAGVVGAWAEAALPPAPELPPIRMGHGPSAPVTYLECCVDVPGQDPNMPGCGNDDPAIFRCGTVPPYDAWYERPRVWLGLAVGSASAGVAAAAVVGLFLMRRAGGG
jgi:hypothetical protein